MIRDPGSGLCTPCRLLNGSDSKLCSTSDPTRCDSDYQCRDGFYCSSLTGQCTTCTINGCLRCSDDASKCNECSPGYWDASEPINNERYRASTVEDRSELEELPMDCQPCIDKHCLMCDISYGAACEVCSDGYFLDRKTKRCRAVGVAFCCFCCWCCCCCCSLLPPQ